MNGTPNHRNKAVFSNSSGIMWMLPKSITKGIISCIVFVMNSDSLLFLGQ